MEHKTIVEARKRAEKAIADMPDGDVKLKAFEVILAKLLEAPEGVARTTVVRKVGASTRSSGAAQEASGLQGRIMELASDGFFSKPKGAADIKLALGTKGHHHKNEDIAVALLRLVRRKTLRRIPDTKKGRSRYLYCLP